MKRTSADNQKYREVVSIYEDLYKLPSHIDILRGINEVVRLDWIRELHD